jgi:hypothetical protein
MTLIWQIKTDYCIIYKKIRVNPPNPCNLCSNYYPILLQHFLQQRNPRQTIRQFLPLRIYNRRRSTANKTLVAQF